MLQRPVPCENLISRWPCAHDGSAPHIAHAATPKVTLRPRNPRRVTSAMKDSFLSNLIGLVPEGIRDEQGVCRAEDVGRPGIAMRRQLCRAPTLFAGTRRPSRAGLVLAGCLNNHQCASACTSPRH